MIENARNILVVTGAGVSASSGISTWRAGKDAIWSKDVMEKGTTRYFKQDPVGAWTWYLEKFGMVANLKPNKAHEALVKMEMDTLDNRGEFLLVTQNVDHLHKKAGNKNVVEVHGKTSHVRCPHYWCDRGGRSGSIAVEEIQHQLDRFKETKSEEDLPTCPKCGAIVRAHALWFDESYHSHDDYQVGLVSIVADTCDLILFVGTSFSVGITEYIYSRGRLRGVPMISIDPNPVERAGLSYIREDAEKALPELVGL